MEEKHSPGSSPKYESKEPDAPGLQQDEGGSPDPAPDVDRQLPDAPGLSDHVSPRPVPPVVHRDLRLAWVSLSALVLGLLFISWYPLGGVGPLAISHFIDAQQKVLLFALPLGLGLAVGFIVSLYTRPKARWRFFWSGFIFFLFQLSLTRFEYFIPIFVWCSGALPNPSGWGLILASAGIATFVSFKMNPLLKDGASRKRLSRMIALAAVLILFGSSAFLAPFFYAEWRKAPVVLSDRYYLAWELAIPAHSKSHVAGFWFASRQTAPHGFSTFREFIEPPTVSESEEAVFVTDRWIGCVRLHDGTLLWGKEFAFRVPGEKRDLLSVYVAEDRIHVIVRNPSGDIHTFRKSDGELMWELKDLGFKYEFGDPRVGAVATPNFIIATYADGRPSYMVIDSKMGSVTEHPLPVPDGMVVPVTETGASRYVIGPAVLEGYGGALAISAYFARTETVPDYWGLGEPLPEEAYLFGIDQETGEIAWQVQGVGNWREDLQWPLQHLWFDGHSVVWTGGYNSNLIRVWDTATGSLRWSKSFPTALGRVQICPSGVVIGETDGMLHFFDMSTGDLRWSYDPGTWELKRLFFIGDTLLVGRSGSLSGIRTSDGSVSFDVAGSYRIRGIQDGNLVVELTDLSEPRIVHIDPETGRQSDCDAWDFPAPWELRTARYLLSLRSGEAGVGNERLEDLFKAEGELGFIEKGTHPVQNLPSSGEVTKEGGILITAYDEEKGVYHLYLLRQRER